MADLTNEARLGYHAGPTETSPFLATSNSDSAWRIGAWLRQTFRSPPSGVRPSRGNTFHVNTMKVQMTWTRFGTSIDRVA